MSLALTGIGVSRGIAIGKVHTMLADSMEILEAAIPDGLIDSEVERFLEAVDTARLQLSALRQQIPSETRADISGFIDTHLLILADASIVDTPVNIIRDRRCNAEWALKVQRDAVMEVFEQMDDAYLRTRMDDVDHVINRVQRTLFTGSVEEIHAGISLKDRILLASDLTPAETILLQHQGISAFATEYGGPLSHTAILARSVQLPAVVGVHAIRHYLHDGDEVILDGQQGVLIADPDQDMLEYYRERQVQEKQRRIELANLAQTPAVTLDSTTITLMSNIELPNDVEAINRENTDGVGLYRTEFLFMNRADTPDEEEQYRSYVGVVDALKGKPLTIRTLDMGSDKQVDGVGADGRCASNPALGLRAIRLCLRDPGLFCPQLRAILRASAHGPVRIMIPMLSNLHEIHQVHDLIEDAKRSLQLEGLAFDPHIQTGGMIEIPAAAVSAASFAHHLDFLSIGTNDLIQYTLAIDRIDNEVNYLYDPLHPAVLHLIKKIIDAGNAVGIPVAMCGEMAGDTRYTRLLLGMGLTEFSMHHTALQEVKRIINQSSIALLVPQVDSLLQSAEPDQINTQLEELNTTLN